MAKNFTQFQEISGTADNTSGVREHNLPDTIDKDSAYVVGYVSDEPGGEARFSLRSILLTCDQVDIGLHNVTNESKETMFTSPTFTGETITIEGDLQVNGSVTSTGATTTVDSVTVVTKATQINNNGISIPLDINHVSGSEFDTIQVTTGSSLSFHVDSVGRVGIGTDASDNHQLTIGHIPGESTTEATLAVIGSISATGAVNGADIEAMDDKLATVELFATNWTSLNNVSTKLQAQHEYNQQNGTGITIQVARGFDLLEDGETYVKMLSSFQLAPISNVNHRASDAWELDEGNNIGSGTPLAGESGYGTWDASFEKLRKIEYLADNTKANSSTINFSQVPDGPSTGDNETTYVKMTSAERIALGAHSSVTGEPGGIRTVSKTLFTGDTGDLLTASHITSAYEQQADYHWSQDKDDEYEGQQATRTYGTDGVRLRSIQAVLNKSTTLQADGDAELRDVTVETLSAGVIEVETSLVVTNPGTIQSNPNSKDYEGLSTSINVGGKILHFENGILWKVTDENGQNPIVTEAT